LRPVKIIATSTIGLQRKDYLRLYLRLLCANASFPDQQVAIRRVSFDSGTSITQQQWASY